MKNQAGISFRIIKINVNADFKIIKKHLSRIKLIFTIDFQGLTRIMIKCKNFVEIQGIIEYIFF